MKKLFSIIAAALLLTSCVDTVLLPDDKTVDEDYWQTKSDVNQMVQGAYQAMCSSNFITRLIVWGDFRSDELVPVTSINNTTMTALNEINSVNIQTTNTFADWSSVYSVINTCNVVLEKAGGTMSIDPSYTEGDYQADRAQMLALRSLCYFYLVRNFRDVPYITTAYMNSSQEMNIPQAAPDSVLQGCINDLVEAEGHAYDPAAYTDWRRTGLINRDAIDAILADIYLWRASVTGSADDYQQCVAYCDKVIASKQQNHVQGIDEIELKEYPLADGRRAFTELFVTQNAEESIFELQFDGNNNSNTGYCSMLYKYANNNSRTGYMKTTSVLGEGGSVYTNNNQNRSADDYRFTENVYEAGSSSGTYNVRKGVAPAAFVTGQPTSTGQAMSYDRTYGNYAQNYIFYRLSDVMLMKAEALTQLAAGDQDVQLRQAFNLVQAVNSRSIYSANLSADSIRWQYYSNKASMEDLVLNERLRELSFEGKRYYDIMRYNYRRIQGADYTKTFYELDQEGYSFARNDANSMALITRKYTSGTEGSAAAAKLRYETNLYMPIYHSEIVVNPALRQNPAYSDVSDFEKN